MASFEENYRSWWSWKMMEMRSEIWSLQADLLLQTSTSWAFESHAGRYFLSEIVKHIMRANLDELVFFFTFMFQTKYLNLNLFSWKQFEGNWIFTWNWLKQKRCLVFSFVKSFYLREIASKVKLCSHFLLQL